MAISSSYYINAPSLGSATAVFTDSSLLTCAADGFYSDGIISREQVGCVLLPQQTCPSCYTAYELGYSELSCEEACSSTPVTYYSGCDELVLYYCYLWTDPELTIEAPAGYYSDGINCYDYRFPHSGIISITPCSTPPTVQAVIDVFPSKIAGNITFEAAVTFNTTLDNLLFTGLVTAYDGIGCSLTSAVLPPFATTLTAVHASLTSGLRARVADTDAEIIFFIIYRFISNP